MFGLGLTSLFVRESSSAKCAIVIRGGHGGPHQSVELL